LNLFLGVDYYEYYNKYNEKIYLNIIYMKLFNIMTCRGKSLDATTEGLKQTGIDLIAYNDVCNNIDSKIYSAAGLTDNLGIFYLLPKLSVAFNIPASSIAVIFYSLVVIISYVIGTIALWRICTNKYSKVYSLAMTTFLALIMIGINDYYVFYGAVPFLLFPIFLLIRKTENFKLLLFYFILSSIIISISHLIRSHSGTSMILIFIVFLIFFAKHISFKKKILIIFAYTIVSFVIFTYFQSIIDTRNEFLLSLNQDYNYDLNGYRIMWHNIYYSLGYLANNISYGDWQFHQASDQYSLEKAKSIDPNVIFASIEYENILRDETFKFILEHPLFFINTVFAKFGVLIMYFIIFCNIGILFINKLIINKIEYFFYILTGIVFNCSFGILTLPYYVYLMGLFFFSTVISIISVNEHLKES